MFIKPLINKRCLFLVVLLLNYTECLFQSLRLERCSADLCARSAGHSKFTPFTPFTRYYALPVNLCVTLSTCSSRMSHAWWLSILCSVETGANWLTSGPFCKKSLLNLQYFPQSIMANIVIVSKTTSHHFRCRLNLLLANHLTLQYNKCVCYLL